MQGDGFFTKSAFPELMTIPALLTMYTGGKSLGPAWLPCCFFSSGLVLGRPG